MLQIDSDRLTLSQIQLELDLEYDPRDYQLECADTVDYIKLYRQLETARSIAIADANVIKQIGSG